MVFPPIFGGISGVPFILVMCVLCIVLVMVDLVIQPIADKRLPGIQRGVLFLAYALVVQSLMIHMQTYCGLTQPPAGGPEGVVIGNVFDLQPGYNAMRAAVLTGHLSRDDEKRLLNCFGPDYMRTATSLLSLGWLRSAPVSRNLLDVYGVKLLGA
jgi:hypothetical protein